MVSGLGEFINSAKRVFTVSKKPDSERFLIMLRVTAIGIIIIAIIGFIVYLLFALTGIGL